MKARRTEMHALVGAYVLDAVPGSDRADFERHVHGCEQCREDVRGLREAAARLSSAAAVAPRPELRDQMLEAAARVRQLPPVIASESTPRPSAQAPLRQWRRLVWPGTGRQAWLARVAATVVVVLAAAAVALGLHLTGMQSRLSLSEQRDQAIAAVLGAHDAVTLTAQIRTGGTATVVMSHRARSLVFVANGLPSLPASKAYELWLMSPAGDTAVGMLPPGHNGMTGPMVVNRLGPGDRLGVTVEPAAGSRRPTSAPIVLVGLGS